MKNVEIERKFLVRKKDICFDLKKFKHCDISQSFLYIKPAIRIRKMDKEYSLTIKTKPPKDMNSKNDLARTEYEVLIPRKCYKYLLKLSVGRAIEKTRYYIPYKNYTIELDVFRGPLKGLIYAEIEFKSLKSAIKFTPPAWFFKDVTGIEKYKNTQLSICKNIKNVLKY